MKAGFYGEFGRTIAIEDLAAQRKADGREPATYNYTEDEIPQRLSMSPIFDAIWTEIKEWDVNVPYAYGGYCGASGSHVYAILKALGNAGIIDLDQIMTDAVSDPKKRMLR
jgi:hypothetical protein